jgi:thiosulfate/3-mercaptopyruvate sulfurtransferase
MAYVSLISAAELSRHLNDSGWLVVDCRFDLMNADKGQESYLSAHVPGAFYAHLDHQLSSPITPQTGRHPLPDMVALQDWLGVCGFDGSQQVVAYDDLGGAMAVRLWWLLKALGHDAVALLDGGWQAWKTGGYPVDDRSPQAAAAVYRAEFDGSLVVSTAAVEANLKLEHFTLVDVRTAERFEGVKEPIDPVAGHIPGATNSPLGDNLNAQGYFKSVQEIQELYQPLLEERSVEQLVFMCGSGVTACHSILALVYAGFPMPRVYAGSWSEWIRNPGHPVAVGSETGV